MTDSNKTKKWLYSVEPYDVAWIEKFKKIRTLLEEVFGKKALQIEHVGSTSIPNMKAKPLIDVLVAIDHMEPFTTERELMAKHGYFSIDNYIGPDTILFYKEENERKLENIHICIKDSENANKFILGRDYLRAHPKIAEEYSHLKKSLHKQFPDDYPAYRAGKHEFLQKVEKEAKEWRGNQSL